MGKRQNPKIAIVGGGSYNWTPTIMNDLIQDAEIDGADIWLLDPDLTAANEVKACCEKINEIFKKSFRFTATDDEDAAFKKADFVIITISTGRFETMTHDLKIPEKYGIFHTVGDTAGPGGWNRALRNIPVFVGLAKKIEKLSPRAVVLNYTNPMASLTNTIASVSNLRVVGLCHSPLGSLHFIRKLFQVEEQDVTIKFAGVNHFFWVIDFAIKGEPGYPKLAKLLKNKHVDDYLRETYKDEAGFVYSAHNVMEALYRQYGYLVYSGDRHTCEFVPGFITPSADRVEQFRLVRTTIADREEGLKKARQRTLDLASGVAQPRPRSRETAVDIIKAFILDRPFHDVANLPNIGQIDNLPRGAVVEGYGLVNALGFHPVASGSIPDVIQPMLMNQCLVQKLTVKAALAGDRELAFQALAADPLCGHLTPTDIRNMGRELMEATAAWLPQF